MSITEMFTNIRIVSFLLIAALIAVNVVKGCLDGKNFLDTDSMICQSSAYLMYILCIIDSLVNSNFLIVSFDVGGSFNYSPNTFCNKFGIINEYATVLEAQRACMNDAQCDVVFDHKCGGHRFFTCQGPVQISIKGSCTWEKLVLKRSIFSQ